MLVSTTLRSTVTVLFPAEADSLVPDLETTLVQQVPNVVTSSREPDVHHHGEADDSSSLKRDFVAALEVKNCAGFIRCGNFAAQILDNTADLGDLLGVVFCQLSARN